MPPPAGPPPGLGLLRPPLRAAPSRRRLLFIASSGAPQAEAIDAYADRWQVETLFGCLKTRGFNFEDTHLTDPGRLSKLMGLLALAFAWTYRTGQLLHEQKPILLKKPSSAPSSPCSATDSTSSATSH